MTRERASEQSLTPENILDFQKNGFSLLKARVSSEQVEQLIERVEIARRDKSSAGERNLLVRSPEIKTCANSGGVYEIARQLVGGQPIPVRAILFDKTPDANWYVTWHQDLSIPVRERVDTEGYGSWSIKNDVVHVQPPAAILERMVTLRIHLDSCSEKNGPIKFIGGSHLSGVLTPIEIGRWRAEHKTIVCTAERGDIIAMRPLILHSSSAAESLEHRRVLHLEYAFAELPDGMRWAEA